MPEQLEAARKLLSDTELIAFLRAAGREEHPRAPGYMCKDLDNGRALDEIFKEPRPGNRRVVLEVKPVSTRTFEITAGYRGEIGDGGTWLVVFTAGGEVQQIEERGWWRH